MNLAQQYAQGGHEKNTGITGRGQWVVRGVGESTCVLPILRFFGTACSAIVCHPLNPEHVLGGKHISIQPQSISWCTKLKLHGKGMVATRIQAKRVIT